MISPDVWQFLASRSLNGRPCKCILARQRRQFLLLVLPSKQVVQKQIPVSRLGSYQQKLTISVSSATQWSLYIYVTKQCVCFYVCKVAMVYVKVARSNAVTVTSKPCPYTLTHILTVSL